MSGSASTYPQSTVVEVESDFYFDGFQGSGVLIAPDEVLTASHLIYGGPGRGEAIAAAVTLASGGFDLADSVHYFQVPVDIAGDLALKDSQYDYALLHLSEPLTQDGTQDLLANFPGGSVSISGYPASGNDSLVTVTQTVTKDPTLTLLDGFSTGQGSSGGPLYVTGTGTPSVVGLVSSGDASQNLGFDVQITPGIIDQIHTWENEDRVEPYGGIQAATLPLDNRIGTGVSFDGDHTNYSVVDQGSAYVEDTGIGAGFGEHLSASSEVLYFSDGIGVFDSTGTTEAIARLYRAALGRTPDVTGLNDWSYMARHENLSLDQIAQDFVNSSEFKALHGSASGETLVSQLYQVAFGRPGDAAGIANWTQQLASGTSVVAIVEGFANSREEIADTASYSGDTDTARAYRLYKAALDRAPDAGGLAFWTNRLDQGVPPTDVAQGFIGSQEFMARYGSLDNTAFVNALYVNALDRPSDPGGLANWVGQLNNGASRASVLLGFSDSLENRLDTAPATHDGWVFASY